MSIFKIKSAVLASFAALAMAGCARETEYNAPAKKYYDFSTSHIHNLSVNYNLPEGCAGVHFEVYAEDPASTEGIIPIFAANTTPDGVFAGKIKVPSYADRLYFTVEGQDGACNVESMKYNAADGSISLDVQAAPGSYAAASRSMSVPGPYTITYMGLVAFEDLWPCQGDYDFNDVVVRYSCTHFYTEDNFIEKMVHEFTPVRKGVALRDGFGYEINGGRVLTRSSELLYKRVTVETFDMAGAPVAKALPRYPRTAKGFEEGQNYPVVMLFEDVEEEVGGPQYDYVGGQQYPILTYRVTLELNGPSYPDFFGFPPYNPFIVVADPGSVPSDPGARNKEVHLPNHVPTTKGYNDQGKWFGHYDDRSNPAAKQWYVSDIKFPFAIDIPNTRLYMPLERQRIDNAYPEFARWAETEGVENPYWYWFY